MTYATQSISPHLSVKNLGGHKHPARLPIARSARRRGGVRSGDWSPGTDAHRGYGAPRPEGKSRREGRGSLRCPVSALHHCRPVSCPSQRRRPSLHPNVPLPILTEVRSAVCLPFSCPRLWPFGHRQASAFNNPHCHAISHQYLCLPNTSASPDNRPQTLPFFSKTISPFCRWAPYIQPTGIFPLSPPSAPSQTQDPALSTHVVSPPCSRFPLRLPTNSSPAPGTRIPYPRSYSSRTCR